MSRGMGIREKQCPDYVRQLLERAVLEDSNK